MPSETNPDIWECNAQYSHAMWLQACKVKALETAFVQSKKKINYIHWKRTMKCSGPPFEFQIFFGKESFSKSEISQNWNNAHKVSLVPVGTAAKKHGRYSC